MHIVTSGFRYLDIDAYGGIIAYADLLQKQGVDAKAVSLAPPNESITATVQSWNPPLLTTYTPAADDVFTIVDVSEPGFFDSFVVDEKIVGMIDHHAGYEDLWQQRLGDASHIDFIGAACTLVYEAWVAADLLDVMSPTSARLLICGILDNTLNFEATVTTPRDHQAYEALLGIANLPEDWPAQYFRECQAGIEADLGTALRGDTKLITENTHLPAAFGQLVVWDAQSLLAQIEIIANTLRGYDSDWLLSIVNIGEGRNYFIADNPPTQDKIGALLGVTFVDNIAKSDRLWLRKEIIKQSQQ